ncbi:MAG TPA: glycosyltransferase family 9 protein [Candidatus Kapabacteria bacterium]|nr:glycosyltransferase family 9 protein [Candidatus Kapabacteria bacterium]
MRSLCGTYLPVHAMGRLKGKTPCATITHGSGPPESVAIACRGTGIGDTVHEMPALWQKKQEGCDITYIAPRNRRLLIESLGIRFMPLDTAGAGWEERNKGHYGKIYSTFAWCLIPHIAPYTPAKIRFAQFADCIETTLPERFSWDCLRSAQEKITPSEILFAPFSYNNLRMLNRWHSIARELQTIAPVTVIGTDKRFVEKFGIVRARNTRELIGYVERAKLVLAVDNGVLALALALRKPTIGIFGPTDPALVFHQFGKYHEIHGVAVQPTKGSYRMDCRLPCNFQSNHGWNINARCSIFADCMLSYTIQDSV